MPKKWDRIDDAKLAGIESIAKDLQDAILSIRNTMKANDLKTVESPWTESHATCLSKVFAAIDQTKNEMAHQIVAKRLKSLTRVEADRKRNGSKK